MRSLPATASAPPNGPELRDIHLPPTPSWWSPAPGWWLLAGLAFVVVLSALWWSHKRRQASTRRQRVLSEVDRLQKRHLSDGNSATMAAGLHQLMRRVARQHDQGAATQIGAAWRTTLDRLPMPPAAIDRLMALGDQMYRANPAFDPSVAAEDVKTWIRLALKPSAWKGPVKESTDA